MMQSLARGRGAVEVVMIALAFIGAAITYGLRFIVVTALLMAMFAVIGVGLDRLARHHEHRSVRHLTCAACGIRVFTDMDLGRCPHCGATS